MVDSSIGHGGPRGTKVVDMPIDSELHALGRCGTPGSTWRSEPDSVYRDCQQDWKNHLLEKP